MRKLTGLTDQLEHYEDPEEGKEPISVTYRTAIAKQLAMLRTKEEEDIFLIFDLGKKLRTNELISELEIDDREFKLVGEAIRTNGPGYIAHYQAQLLRRLKSWEKGEA
jgi:hypothetical protein